METFLPSCKNHIIMILILMVSTTGFCSLNAAPPEPDPALTASISGFVKDTSNGETLIGAAVSVKGTKKGAYTNRNGFYSITGIEPGEYTVVVSMIGYKANEKKYKFKKGDQIRETFNLSSKDVKTEEITVTADKELEKRQITVSKINVPVDQIKDIRIGGESDVFRSLQKLPGVLSASQVSSGLYIRGGSPDQNLILLDGSTVYNAQHLFGFISTFNTEAVKDVELIKGGYPAEYGNRLSSVLNITQKDGNREKYEGTASLGMLSSKLTFEGPVGNGSFMLAGRRNYFDLITGLLNNDPANPLPSIWFYDLNGKISQDIGQNDKVYLSGFLSYDDFGFSGSGLDMSMYNLNKVGSLKWQHVFGDDLFSYLVFTTSNYTTGYDQKLSRFLIKVENKITDYNLKGSFEWFTSDVLTSKFGFEVTKYDFQYQQNFTGDGSNAEEGTTGGGIMNIKPEDWTYSTYGQMNYRFLDDISLQAGLRLNYWDLSGILSLDPRLALRYQVDDNFAVKASWGIFHQYLRLASVEGFSFFDTWLPTDSTVNASTASHYILSLETSPYPGWDVSLDFYYKDLKNISELNQNNIMGNTVADVFFSGDGKAYGAELFIQKKFGRLTGWFGYSLGWVDAQFDEINGGNTFRPKYDRRHSINLIAQYDLNKRWSFGMSFTFQSGQSFTGATSRIQGFMPGMNYGKGMVIPSERYGLRLPPSHQLDLMGAYSFQTFGLSSRLIMDIYNVYSRRDIMMRYYDTSGSETTVKDVLLLPIIPSLSYELKF